MYYKIVLNCTNKTIKCFHSKKLPARIIRAGVLSLEKGKLLFRGSNEFIQLLLKLFTDLLHARCFHLGLEVGKTDPDPHKPAPTATSTAVLHSCRPQTCFNVGSVNDKGLILLGAFAAFSSICLSKLSFQVFTSSGEP